MNKVLLTSPTKTRDPPSRLHSLLSSLYKPLVLHTSILSGMLLVFRVPGYLEFELPYLTNPEIAYLLKASTEIITRNSEKKAL